MMRCSVWLLVVLGVPLGASADTFSFKLQKTGEAWTCSGGRQPGQTPLDVAIAIPSPPPADDAIKLTARVTPAAGAALSGPFTKVSNDLWRYVHTSKETQANRVEVAGTVEGKTVSCAFPVEGSGSEVATPVSRASMKGIDFAAAEWLDQNDWRLDAIRGDIKRQYPKWPLDRIVFLPHLPSGAKAPSYPTSISERDLAQVVMVVPDVETTAGSGGSVDWALTRCESIPTYRVRGDIAGLAEAQSTRDAKRELKFKLVRIGHTMSCGAEALAYTLTVTADAGAVGEPVPSSVAVRPVFNIGATGMFGYDRTMQSTFAVRDGKIYEARDRVGTGLLAGGTYFVNGLDPGDMRWYNHVFNPFIVVSLESPKERFVVGTVLMERVGFGLALGVAFNHVKVLSKGYTVGQAFAGPGDIPVDPDWTQGFYIGVAMDNTLFSQFRKLKKSGGGGGTAQPADVAAAEKKKKQEEDAKKAEGAKK
jgi:hypothetical protein